MSGERILIVEDDKEQSEALYDMLVYRGYEVERVDSVVGAEQMCVSYSPHLVVIDLLLVNSSDKRDGFAAISSVRRLRKMSVGILVWTTNFAHPRDEIRALRAGADDYVRKDIDFGLIEARIEALIRRVVI